MIIGPSTLPIISSAVQGDLRESWLTKATAKSWLMSPSRGIMQIKAPFVSWPQWSSNEYPELLTHHLGLVLQRLLPWLSLRGPVLSDFNFPYQLLEIRLIFSDRRRCALPILRLDFFYNLLQWVMEDRPLRCHNYAESWLATIQRCWGTTRG